MKVQSSFWWLLLVVKLSSFSLFNTGVLAALVISEKQIAAKMPVLEEFPEVGALMEGADAEIAVINRFTPSRLSALHARRIARVTAAISPDAGRLLSESHNRISTAKLNWLLGVIQSCETPSLDLLQAKLTSLVSDVSAGDGRAIAVTIEIERARWASEVVGRFRSVSDIQTEAEGELARLAEKDVLVSAEFARSRRTASSRSGRQLFEEPLVKAVTVEYESFASFMHGVTRADWTPEEVSAGAPMRRSSSMGTASLARLRRSSARLSPLGVVGASSVRESVSPGRLPTGVSPRSQALLDRSPDVFRIGQMSPT